MGLMGRSSLWGVSLGPQSGKWMAAGVEIESCRRGRTPQRPGCRHAAGHARPAAGPLRGAPTLCSLALAHPSNRLTYIPAGRAGRASDAVPFGLWPERATGRSQVDAVGGAIICLNCCTGVPHKGNTVGGRCGVTGKRYEFSNQSARDFVWGGCDGMRRSSGRG
jgi:hypothetical protein